MIESLSHENARRVHEAALARWRRARVISASIDALMLAAGCAAMAASLYWLGQ